MKEKKFLIIFGRLVASIVSIVGIANLLTGITEFNKTPEKVGIGLSFILIAIFVLALANFIDKRIK